MSLSLKVINPSRLKTHQGTIFFFHGSGSTGEDLEQDISYLFGKKFSFPHLKVVFPTAPLQPYTPLGGEYSNVWFDRLAVHPRSPEVVESVTKISQSIKELILSENNQGIPNNKIIVGGFSMGGALALHTALRLNTSLAGVFAISSFLNIDSIVYDHLKKIDPSKETVPELLQFHGDEDDLVHIKFGKDTFDKLTALNVKGRFIPKSNIDHTICKEQLSTIYNWIEEKIPLEDN